MIIYEDEAYKLAILMSMHAFFGNIMQHQCLYSTCIATVPMKPRLANFHEYKVADG